VILLVIIIFVSSFFVYGEDALEINENKYVAWYIACNDCTEIDKIYCSETTQKMESGVDIACPFVPFSETNFPDFGDYIEEEECGFDNIEPISLDRTKGCLVAAVDENDGIEVDDCAWRYVSKSFIFTWKEEKDLPNPYPYESLGWDPDYNDDDWDIDWGDSWGGERDDDGDTGGDAELILRLFSSINNKDRFFDHRSGQGLKIGNYAKGEYICSDDALWYACLPPTGEDKSDLNSLTWADGKLYSCVESTTRPGFYEWKKLGKDLDHDSFVDHLDSEADSSYVQQTGSDCNDGGLPRQIYDPLLSSCQNLPTARTTICNNFDWYFPIITSYCDNDDSVSCRYGKQLDNLCNHFQGVVMNSCQTLFSLNQLCKYDIFDNYCDDIATVYFNQCTFPLPASGICSISSQNVDLEICSEIEFVEDCTKKLAYRQCPICINPGAPEVCGDGINNDCRGDDGADGAAIFSAADDLLGKTPDYCNLFKEGCEQKTLENVVPNPYAEEGAEEPVPVQHRNVYNGYYSWIDTPTGGYCCGYADGEADKSSDVGKLGPEDVVGEGWQNDRYLCLPSDDVATFEFGHKVIGSGTGNIPGWDGDNRVCTSENDWCWLSANQDPFKILSISPPDGSTPFDIVSNSNQWVQCAAEGTNDVVVNARAGDPAPEDPIANDPVQIANRFYCYDEGNRWSWAECLQDTETSDNGAKTRSDNGAKTRDAGDGLFGLKLYSPTGANIQVNPSVYSKFYHDTSLSVKDYDYLEFMFQYTGDIVFPASLFLRIQGPGAEGDQNVINKNILGDITNNADLKPNQWMHVKVQLPEGLEAIKDININSYPRTNQIEVKNVYLSRAEGNTPLCSGKPNSDLPAFDGESTTVWITDMDYANPGSFLDGEELCNALYDPTAGLAWIEGNDDVGIAPMCCGNDKGEYASGAERGCWNSVILQEDQTAGNVEIQVEYMEQEYDIENLQYFPVYLKFEFVFDTNLMEQHNLDERRVAMRRSAELAEYLNDLRVIEGRETFSDIASIPKSILFRTEETDQIITSISIQEQENYEVVMGIPLFEPYDGGGITEITEINIDSFGGSSILPLQLKTTVKEEADLTQARNLLEATPKPLTFKEDPVQLTFTCTSNECVFPLPGESDPTADAIDYKIKNNNPGQYDLYLVLSNYPKEDILLPAEAEIDIQALLSSLSLPLSSSSIPATANIRAKRIPQNVLYTKEVDPDYGGEINYQFYGCNAGTQSQSGLSLGKYEDLTFCDVKGEYFCAFSETQPPIVHTEDGSSTDDTEDSKYISTIGTWSRQTIPQFGYEPVPDDVSLENMDEHLVLRDPEGEEEKESEQRTFPSQILPGRNILPNPYFSKEETWHGTLLYWDIFDNVGTTENPLYQVVAGESTFPIVLPPEEWPEGYTETNGPREIVLAENQMLLSDRIAIPREEKLHFSYQGRCDDVQAILYDTSSPSTTAPTKITLSASGTSFNTETYSYVSFQFTGNCDIKYPLLQLDDGKGIAEFSYNLRYPSKKNPRAAAACCPTNYCWNGFTCVEPMTDDTLIAEHVGDDRNYRCIEGSWVELPLLSDWNAEKQGFCSFEDQCFIVSSRNTEIIDNEHIIASIPKEGSDQLNFHQQTEITGVKFPTCINNSEFIMDHYCSQGDWTSRTKFLAGQLLEEAGSSDYSIYCSDPKAVLADFDGKEPQILGGGEGTMLPSDSLIPGSVPSVTSASCFPLPTNPEAERLIPVEDNTCINSACILKHEAGNVIFATTLNKPISDDDSLLRAFDQHPSICGDDGVCATTESFVGELRYVPDINALIYGRDGISRPLSLVVLKDKIVTFLSDFFGREETLSSTLQFVQEADNFRDIYLLKADGKEVQAVKEILPKTSPSSVSKHSIIADYTGFESPICAFLNARHLGSAWPPDLLEPEKVNCVTIDDTQRIEISVTPGKKNLLNQVWPQLTGKLRPEVEG